MNERPIRTLKTATGKSFEVAWCGISMLDELFFDLKTASFSEAFDVFNKPDETSELLYNDGKADTKILQYTDLQAIQKVTPTGYIRVCLMVPQEEGEGHV